MAPGSVNLVNVEGVRLAYGTRVLLDGVSLGRRGRRPHRRGRPQRLGEELAARGAGPVDAHRTAGGSRTPATCVSGSCRRATTSTRTRPSARPSSATVPTTPGARTRPRGRRSTRCWPGSTWTRRSVRCPVASAAAWRWPPCSSTTPDLLLLDEPTNHLDVDGVAWLAGHLAARRGALVAVTHDRWFLDAVAERTWEVVDGAVEAYDGGYCRVRAREGGTAPAGRRPPRTAGATCSARSWRGCVAVHPRGPRSPGSGSTPRTRSSPTSRRRATASSWSRPRGAGSAAACTTSSR